MDGGDSDNATGAANQQERLDAYIAGFVDGEGSLFEKNPLLSCKHEEFLTFAGIVRRMAEGEHLELEGFRRIAGLAVCMNGGGRYRRLHRSVESRILRDHMPGTDSKSER